MDYFLQVLLSCHLIDYCKMVGSHDWNWECTEVSVLTDVMNCLKTESWNYAVEVVFLWRKELSQLGLSLEERDVLSKEIYDELLTSILTVISRLNLSSAKSSSVENVSERVTNWRRPCLFVVSDLPFKNVLLSVMDISIRSLFHWKLINQSACVAFLSVSIAHHQVLSWAQQSVSTVAMPFLILCYWFVHLWSSSCCHNIADALE